MHSLVAVLHVIAATAPRPIVVQVIGPGAARATARRQLSVAAGARYEAGRTGCGQCVHERHFRRTCTARTRTRTQEEGG